MKRCVSKGKSLSAVRGRGKERAGADAKSRARHRLHLGKVFAKNEWDILVWRGCKIVVTLRREGNVMHF